MAINVMLIFFTKTNPHTIKKWGWLYCLICYGGPFIISLICLKLRSPGKSLVYGNASVSLLSRAVSRGSAAQHLPPHPRPSMLPFPLARSARRYNFGAADTNTRADSSGVGSRRIGILFASIPIICSFGYASWLPLSSTWVSESTYFGPVVDYASCPVREAMFESWRAILPPPRPTRTRYVQLGASPFSSMGPILYFVCSGERMGSRRVHRVSVWHTRRTHGYCRISIFG